MRTRNAAQRVRAPEVAGWVVAGLVLVGGVVLALTRGAAPAAVVVSVVLGAAVGAAASQLPRRWSLPALLVALVVGAGVLVRVDRASTPAWFGGVVLGLVLGLVLLWRRQQRSAATEPPRGAGTRPAGLRLVLDDGTDDVDTGNPAPDDARRAVLALDGRTRTGVSVFRGASRLDVGGDAAGPVVVFQCDDATARRPVWWVVADGPDPRAGAEVEVRVVGLDAHLPAGGVTDLPAALAALDAFLLTGGRAAGLGWYTDPAADDLRAPFDRWT